MYRVVVVIFSLLAFGCQFDSSVSLTPADTEGGVDSDSGSVGVDDCAGFVPGPCNQCGSQVCVATPSGWQIQCKGDEAKYPCSGGLSCTAGGQCVTQVACSLGITRKCGECGTEQCEGGVWSGECLADDSCQTGTNCLPDAPGTQTCQAACSTEGHRTPYDGFDDFPYQDAGAGFGGLIPDIVEEGDYWLSRDGCDFPGGFRTCVCERKNGYGDLRVKCYYCKSDDD